MKRKGEIGHGKHKMTWERRKEENRIKGKGG